MLQPEPFVLEAGSGPGVVCLHANASTSSQWRGKKDLQTTKYRVLAPESYGAGKSPDWKSDRDISHHDEVAFIEPVLTRAGRALVLIGHSYGAAVALMAAMEIPDRVRALVLYEPSLFSLLDAESPAPNPADGIRSTVTAAVAALEEGNREAAAERYIDYWMGDGSWKQIPVSRQPAIAAAVRNLRRWGHALFTEPTPLAAFRKLDMPVLYLVGRRSPPSARGVARLLVSVLPRVELLEFDGLGHMGPVTHPQSVNEAIARFLERIALK